MKSLTYLLVTLFSCSMISVMGQLEEIGETLLADDPLFDNKPIPVGWEDESAIILGQKTRVLINKSTYGYNKYWVTRTKILLQDKAAVEFFSDFTMSEEDVFEMKVIKPSGTVVEVDTSDAIPVSQGYSLTSFYVNLSIDEVDYKKLAIQNLEVGDIIDYAYASKEKVRDHLVKWKFPLRLSNTLNTFVSYDYTFGSSYPKMAQEFEIELSPMLYFNFKAINGAPDPIVEKLANGNLKYVVAMSNIKRIRSEYFTNSDLTQPTIKFDVSFCYPMRYYRSKLLIGKPGKMNTSLPTEQFKRTLFLSFHPSEQKVLDIFKFNERDPEEYIRKAYKKFQRLIYMSEDEDYRQPSASFARYMYAALVKQGFDAEIVVSTPRENGGVKNVLLKDDVLFAVRVKNGDEYIYSFPFKRVSGFDDWDYRVTGTQAYVFRPTKKFQKFQLTEIVIPDYLPEKNKSLVRLTVDLDSTSLIADIKSESSHRGENKTLYSSDLLQRSDMYYSVGRYYTERTERYYQRSDEIESTERQEWLEDQIERDFRLGKYNNFELKFSGMEDESDRLEYLEEFTVTDLAHRAGKEYLLVDVGRLISGQIALSAEDMERHSDIVSNYVREYEYSITLNIPDGYEVMNADDFRYDLETKAGAFRATIDQSLYQFKVRTVKTYKVRALPKEEWNEMVEFLQEAYEFSQQKLVLAKRR